MYPPVNGPWNNRLFTYVLYTLSTAFWNSSFVNFSWPCDKSIISAYELLPASEIIEAPSGINSGSIRTNELPSVFAQPFKNSSSTTEAGNLTPTKASNVPWNVNFLMKVRSASLSLKNEMSACFKPMNSTNVGCNSLILASVASLASS